MGSYVTRETGQKCPFPRVPVAQQPQDEGTQSLS
jgi:hypothetical protein